MALGLCGLVNSCMGLYMQPLEPGKMLVDVPVAG
jgi:hypothetical protein